MKVNSFSITLFITGLCAIMIWLSYKETSFNIEERDRFAVAAQMYEVGLAYSFEVFNSLSEEEKQKVIKSQFVAGAEKGHYLVWINSNDNKFPERLRIIDGKSISKICILNDDIYLDVANVLKSTVALKRIAHDKWSLGVRHTDRGESENVIGLYSSDELERAMGGRRPQRKW